MAMREVSHAEARLLMVREILETAKLEAKDRLLATKQKQLRVYREITIRIVLPVHSLLVSTKGTSFARSANWQEWLTRRKEWGGKRNQSE